MDSMALDAGEAAHKMNVRGAGRKPFVFMSDAWATDRFIVLSPPEAQQTGLYWDFEGRGSLGVQRSSPKAPVYFRVKPVAFKVYRKAFGQVRRAQLAGDTWLANLTFPSDVETSLSLSVLARCARAPFRVYVRGCFTVFSPERFVRIGRDGVISAFPMKGTRLAGEGAGLAIMEDEKEMAEHTTIVDLIRNDLGMVARRVDVPRFRFITGVETGGRNLLQVSSEVRGELGRGWRGGLGDLLMRLLPAGSVTGAPKGRTCEILRAVEGYERGWYTGVFGFFDGEVLDSCVMIRFVEISDGMRDRMIYKSGGGITIYSDVEQEYRELKDKVYVPFAD